MVRCDEVEVRNSRGGWSGPFEVADAERAPAGQLMVWLRRQSDRTVLATPIAADRIRSPQTSAIGTYARRGYIAAARLS